MSYYIEFQKLGIKCPNWTNGQKKVSCPKCEQRKGGKRNYNLSLNYDEGLYKCHSASCKFEGTVKKGSRNQTKNYSRPTQWKKSHKYPKWFKEQMQDRGISLDTVKQLDIKVSGGWIEFPYYRGEEVINYKKKKVDKDGNKEFRQHPGSEKILYNLNSLEGKTKAILVEGEMDVAAFIEAGVGKDYGIVSVDQGAGQVGHDLTGKLKCLENCAEEIDAIEEWYICTDEDEAGQGQWLEKELVRRIGPFRSKIVSLPEQCNDANEVLFPGKLDLDHDMCCDTLRHILKNAEDAPMPGIKNLDSEVEEMMIEAFKHGRKGGDTTHIPELDKRWTWFPGFLLLVSGIPNHGKGELIRNLAVLKAMHDGWKWAFFAPEDTPVDIFYERLCEVYLGITVKKLRDKDDGLDTFQEGIDFIKDHFFLVDPEIDFEKGDIQLPTNEWVNDRIRFLQLKYGVNAYCKDPWNNMLHIKNGMRDDEYLADALSKEKYFARMFDASIVVNHPKQLHKTKEGEYPVVDYYDLNGGAMWINQVDGFMVNHRPNYHNDPTDQCTDIVVRKVRMQSLVGKPGTAEMIFDLTDMRFKQEKDHYNPFTQSKNSKMNVIHISESGDMEVENKEDDEIPF